MNILALNAGSSSLKFRIEGRDAALLFEGEGQGIRDPSPVLEIRNAAGMSRLKASPRSLPSMARMILAFAKENAQLSGIGHRFVHGGPRLLAHKLIDDAVRAALHEACSFAPLHNPPALAILAEAEIYFPEVPQVACLDTVFHATMPETAKRFPIPMDRLGNGVRRYGFHGLSCESILRQLERPPRRLVIAHLGGGSSVTAVKEGRSIDTSMGLTPDGGVMMQTRSGDLDPGLLIYLLRQGETANSLESLLNLQSGVAGISGASGDIRLARQAMTEVTQLALEMFSISIAKAIAAMATSLEGLDLLVFTGGIGCHDADMRASIVKKLSWLSPFDSLARPAQEEQTIIAHVRSFLGCPELD